MSESEDFRVCHGCDEARGFHVHMMFECGRVLPPAHSVPAAQSYVADGEARLSQEVFSPDRVRSLRAKIERCGLPAYMTNAERDVVARWFKG